MLLDIIRVLICSGFLPDVSQGMLLSGLTTTLDIWILVRPCLLLRMNTQQLPAVVPNVVSFVFPGCMNNGDEERVKIADEMFKHGGYYADHPLARNW